MTRRLLWRMLGASHPVVAHRYESRALVATLALPDVAEAMAAYKEKRRPRFNAAISAHDLASEWWPSDDTQL
jgi:enoyl-CoA hydratase/carnithine racemase